MFEMWHFCLGTLLDYLGRKCNINRILLSCYYCLKHTALAAFHADTVTYMSINILPKKVFKHSRKGRPLRKFECRAYKDEQLCVIACLKEYRMKCSFRPR